MIKNIVNFVISLNKNVTYIIKKKMPIDKLVPSPLKGKRYRAYINWNGESYHIDFGSSKHESYPFHKDSERKLRYVKRHKKDWTGKKFTRITPGVLALRILWGYPDVRKSVKSFNREFKKKKLKVDPEIRGNYLKNFQKKYNLSEQSAYLNFE